MENINVEKSINFKKNKEIMRLQNNRQHRITYINGVITGVCASIGVLVMFVILSVIEAI